MPIFRLGLRAAAVSVALALLGIAALGTLAYQRASGQLQADARERYTALSQLRREALQRHLEGAAGEARYHAENPAVRQALEDLRRGWDALGARASERLRHAYVEANPYPEGRRHELPAADDGSAYSAAHRSHHAWLRRFLDRRGHYDVFLFTAAGDLVYSAFKEDDFGTNFVGGPYRESGLGRVFRAARANPRREFLAFADFEAYAPSHGAPASFLASPILGDEGTLVGVFALQLAIQPIDALMQATAGMGDTGETYAVGPDLLLRSNSRFSPESTILRTRVDTEPARRALAGETGVILADDYRGVRVLSAFAPLEFEGVRWAVLAEIDEAEVLLPVSSLRRFLVAATIGVMLALGVALGLSLAWLMERPPAARPSAAPSA
jgi:methyl-accepting chemotaxis protein